LIADPQAKKINLTNYREAVMSKNFALLSISAALLFSLFLFGVGHAFQIDLKKHAQMKATENSLTAQVSNKPKPCSGRDAEACRKYGPMLR
jgi:hypothetical protein